MAKRFDTSNTPPYSAPYRPNITASKEKVDSLFSLMNLMDTQQIKQFSMVNNIPLNINDINGENLIHKAINIDNILKKEVHRLNIIKFLVQNDVNPDKPNKENQTPLHLACKGQYADIVNYLISLEVNLNYQDNYGSTPFHYALQGQLKLIEPNKTRKDFIIPQKKVDKKRQEKILEIKKDIWELIKDEPFINSIKNTVENSIYGDDIIKNKTIDVYNNIYDRAMKNEPDNYLKSVKEDIVVFQNIIKETIKKTWSNFKDSEDIEIHTIEPNSYIFNDTKLSTLKNTNVKDKIKDEIKKIKDEIKNICKENHKKLVSVDIKSNNLKTIGAIYNNNNKIKSYFKDDKNIYLVKEKFDYKKENEWNNECVKYLHENAMDFADNIIDWDELTFMGGSREITFTNSYDFKKLKYIFALKDIKQKVFYILCDLCDLIPDFLNNLTFNEKNLCEYINNPGLNFNEPTKLAIIMSYNKIFENNLDDFLEIDSFNQDLFDKWASLLSNKDKASAIYTIMCQAACSSSDDNLTGEMSCLIPMLVSALKIHNQNLDNAIKTCMKKYFIEDNMCNNIVYAINILLDDDFTYTEYDCTYEDDEYFKKYNFLKDEMCKLEELVENNHDNKDDENINIAFLEINKLITEKINKMNNKPLTQDIVSLLTYLRNYCSNFKNIKYYKINDLPLNLIRNSISESRLDSTPDSKQDPTRYPTQDPAENPTLYPTNDPTFNPILNPTRQSNYNKNNNDIFDLIKNKNNMYLIPYLNVLIERDLASEKYKSNTYNFSINKLKEAKHLGLYYKGLIQAPYDENIPNIEFNNSIFKITKETYHLYNFKNNKINLVEWEQIPLVGNYLIPPLESTTKDDLALLVITLATTVAAALIVDINIVVSKLSEIINRESKMEKKDLDNIKKILDEIKKKQKEALIKAKDLIRLSLFQNNKKKITEEVNNILDELFKVIDEAKKIHKIIETPYKKELEFCILSTIDVVKIISPIIIRMTSFLLESVKESKLNPKDDLALVLNTTSEINGFGNFIFDNTIDISLETIQTQPMKIEKIIEDINIDNLLLVLMDKMNTNTYDTILATIDLMIFFNPLNNIEINYFIQPNMIIINASIDWEEYICSCENNNITYNNNIWYLIDQAIYHINKSMTYINDKDRKKNIIKRIITHIITSNIVVYEVANYVIEIIIKDLGLDKVSNSHYKDILQDYIKIEQDIINVLDMCEDVKRNKIIIDKNTSDNMKNSIKNIANPFTKINYDNFIASFTESVEAIKIKVDDMVNSITSINKSPDIALDKQIILINKSIVLNTETRNLIDKNINTINITYPRRDRSTDRIYNGNQAIKNLNITITELYDKLLRIQTNLNIIKTGVDNCETHILPYIAIYGTILKKVLGEAHTDIHAQIQINNDENIYSKQLVYLDAHKAKENAISVTGEAIRLAIIAMSYNKTLDNPPIPKDIADSIIRALVIIPTALTTEQITLKDGIIKEENDKNKDINPDTTEESRKLNYNNNCDLKYFKFIPYKYRPPITNIKNDNSEIKGLCENTTIYFNYKIKKLLSILLYSSISEINLFTIIDSNKKLSKAFIDIYKYLCFIHDFSEDRKIKQDITTIITDINKYNAHLLLYHYLFAVGKIYKIPSFNYYELPLPNIKGQFLYFKSENSNLDLVNDIKDNNNLLEDNNLTEDIKIEKQGNTYNNIKNKIYKNVWENIEKNIISGKYIVKKESFKQAKSSRLPPAIKSYLNLFYNYNINLLLQKIYTKIELNNILECIEEYIYIDEKNTFNDKKIRNYFILSKIVQELVKQQMEYYIDSQTNRILTEVIKGIKTEENCEDVAIEINNIILAPHEFSLAMNKIDINKFTKNIHFLSNYQFSNIEDDTKEIFIVYPDEYSNSEILKMKYELIINEGIYEALLENTNLFILDSNGQSPIYPLLKIHVPQVIQKLKVLGLDYKNFDDINPFKFLVSELNNHTYKLTNGDTDFKNWLENFVLYQKNEVKILILSNDNFKNNVPKYLEDSFNVVAYITNQYLSKSIDDDCYKKINNDKEKTDLFLNNIICKEEFFIYKEDEDNIIQSIIDNNHLEIKKIKNNIKKISNSKSINFLKNKQIALQSENSKLESKLGDNFIESISDYKSTLGILEEYEQYFSSPGISTVALSKMIKYDKLNDSLDLVTFKIIQKEIELFKDTNIDLTTALNKEVFNDIKSFYKDTNELSNIYFTYGDYADNNEVLRFTKDLLKFMTNRFICYPYLMLLRKTLSTYFNTIYPNDSPNDIYDKVNYCLTNKLLNDDNQSIKNILYDRVSKDFVDNAVKIFDNEDEERLFEDQTTKDILDTVVALLTINPELSISKESPFFTLVIKDVNAYFDTFISKTILNWLVIIENVFKFNINQGRIIDSITSLIV